MEIPSSSAIAATTRECYQSRRCGRLLPAAGVIEEESGERLAPILQHADEFPGFELRFYSLIRHEGQADAVKRSANQGLHVVNNERSVHRHGQGLPALVELPAVQAGRPMPEVDAPMLEQVVRVFGFECDLKYEGAPTMAAR